MTDSEIGLPAATLAPATQAVTTRNALAVAFNAIHATGRAWHKIGADNGISGAMAFRIALRGYDPKSSAIRQALNLPLFVPTEACPTCGVVHTKRCPELSRRKKTYEENCTAWDTWLATHRAEIDAIVAGLR